MRPNVGEIDCPGGFDDLNLQVYLGLGLVDIQPTLASIATKDNDSGHLFRPGDKYELDFSEPAMLFYAQESTT